MGGPQLRRLVRREFFERAAAAEHLVADGYAWLRDRSVEIHQLSSSLGVCSAMAAWQLGEKDQALRHLRAAKVYHKNPVKRWHAVLGALY